ncbi:protein Star [Onthophagus taurus]|uniref:protein Star n=1 Tax=Onthophagus taurus TaxID=166361 RepID=UPI000C20C6A4|nr:protein Star [Onthophagus taurus]
MTFPTTISGRENVQPTVIPPQTPTKMSSFIFNPTMFKRLMPIFAFFMGFVTVLVVLYIYMRNAAMRHYQFQVNMSKDYELLEVTQDNPQLIAYIRQMHLQPVKETQTEPNDIVLDEPNEEIGYLLKLLKNKKNGVFVEAGAYNDGKTSETLYLEKKLDWNGLLIQPDPRHYFSLKKHDRKNSQAVHGCLSPSPYPKEVSYHHEDRDGVKINSIHANSIIEDTDIFNTRVKCFPLYSLLLAMNSTKIDYLTLKTGGTELQILETLPFDRVDVQVINVHMNKDIEKDILKKFLSTKRYAFSTNVNDSYFFVLKKMRK